MGRALTGLCSKFPLPTSAPLHVRTTRTRTSSTSTNTSFFSADISTPPPMSNSPCIFQLCHNPITGHSEWLLIHDPLHPQEEEETQNQSRQHKSFLSSTSYLDMLNDSRRNHAFHRAILTTLSDTPSSPIVLDIGAGTGLLSMLAAKAMGDFGEKVYACESYIPMVKLMRGVLRRNGMDKRVRVFNKRSDELKIGLDLPSKADVLVSEILDSELLGEGLIPTLQHAHDELLVENPLTIPYRATTYGQLVDCSFLRKLHDLNGNEVIASDGIHLSPSGLADIVRIKRRQYVVHVEALFNEMRLLSEPFQIFDFDFWKRPESNREAQLNVKIISDGTVHGLVTWWEIQLDHGGKIFYSSAPHWISSPQVLADSCMDYHGSRCWCDHWKQCVWFTPGSGMPVSKNSQLSIKAIHDDISMSYYFNNNRQEKDLHMNKLCDHDLVLSPERIAIYGDREWRASILKATSTVFRNKDFSLCVVGDDSIFLAVLAASLLKDAHIILLFPGLQEKGFLYLQAVADANNFKVDRMEIHGRKKSCLTLEDTNGKKVDLLVGEPFYYGNEGLLPWQNLRFWKERTHLDPILSEDAVIMPCKGILKACAMSLPDLWTSRCGLKDVEGFDHSIVNELLGARGNQSDSNDGSCLPYFVWQCGMIKELSEVFTIMELDLSKAITTCCGKVKFHFTEYGICHGIVIWIDWVMDAEHSVVISTGPVHRYWKQGVKLLSKPVTVSRHASSDESRICSAEIEAIFDPVDGELIVQPRFL